MSTAYKLSEAMDEIVPYNRTFSYPVQANSSSKTLVALPPKYNNSLQIKSTSGTSTARFEFPASSYLNPINTFIQIGVRLRCTDAKNVRLQNFVATVIKRARLLYGSQDIENISEVNLPTRMVSEAAGPYTHNTLSQFTISEGIGGTATYVSQNGTASAVQNARLTSIHNCNYASNQNGIQVSPQGALSHYSRPANVSTTEDTFERRYDVQIPLGMFQQGKLIPLKWMASQLALEIDFAPFDEVVCSISSTDPMDYYEIVEPRIMCELLEFDAAYDAEVYRGIETHGLPIKFSSWNIYPLPGSNSARQNFLIPERNRSLKALFFVCLPRESRTCTEKTATDGQPQYPWDSLAFVQCPGVPRSGVTNPPPRPEYTGQYGGWVRDYQWRIGGKYFPSQPVVCGNEKASNGASAAYQEFAKALHVVGNYNMPSGINSARWTRAFNDTDGALPQVNSSVLDWGGNGDIKNNSSDHGLNMCQITQNGPSFFVISADLETSSGLEVAGLNGEEQNDIALTVNYAFPTGYEASAGNFYCMVYYDALFILRPNNRIELIK